MDYRLIKKIIVALAPFIAEMVVQALSEVREAGRNHNHQKSTQEGRT
jgi:hypothetical protein